MSQSMWGATSGARMRAVPVRVLVDDDVPFGLPAGAFVCEQPHLEPVQAVLQPV